MSVNVWLKSEIKTADGFRVNTKHGPAFKGIALSSRNDRLYFMPGELAGVPAVILDFVEEVSAYETMPHYASREPGIYRHKSTFAEVNLADPGGKNGLEYRLKIMAKTLEDVREFVHLFKTGRIRPVESFEAPQGGKSRDELEREINELQSKVEELEYGLKMANCQVEMAEAQVKSGEIEVEIVGGRFTSLICDLHCFNNRLKKGFALRRTKTIIRDINRLVGQHK